MPFLQQSCTHFQYEIKRYVTKRTRFSCCWCSCCHSFTNFLFLFFIFYNSPHGGFICLEVAVARAAGTHQTAQHFLVTSRLFSASWKHVQHHLQHFVLVPRVRWGSQGCTRHKGKYTRTTSHHFLLGSRFPGGDVCSGGGDEGHACLKGVHTTLSSAQEQQEAAKRPLKQDSVRYRNLHVCLHFS